MARLPLRGAVAVLVLVAGSLLPATSVGAADSTATPPWYASITLHGFMEASFSHNFQRPASGVNGLRVFDTQDDSWSLDALDLVVQRQPAGAGDAGFRLDLVAGSSLPRVEAAAGLFRDPATGKAGDFDVRQAFLSYLAPVGQGVRFEVGKFVTHTGYEVIQGHDAINDHATRSLLFGFAIPFTHTGLRVSYPWSSRLSSQVCVMNGWDNVHDNNDVQTLGGQLLWTPSSRWSIVLNGISGSESSLPNTGRRNLADVVLVWKPLERLSLGWNGDLAREVGGADSGRGDAQWEGQAVYLKWIASEVFSLAARGERFRDRQGVRTGTVQTVHELTLTPEFHAPGNLVLRADLRHDRSDVPVFDHRGEAVRQQTTLLVEALLTF